MKSTESLRKALDKALLAYIHKFELIHGVEHEYALNDDLMSSHCFGDYYFTMADIVYDVDNKLPVRLIFEWQDAGIAAHFNGNKETINLHSYARGLRYEGIE